jgi:DNA-binding XRE family transcriptional regulator
MLAASATHSSEKADHSPLSNSVQKVRHYSKFSQAKLAARIGVLLPSINRWEHGRATPLPMVVMSVEHLLQPMGEADKRVLVKYTLKRLSRVKWRFCG